MKSLARGARADTMGVGMTMKEGLRKKSNKAKSEKGVRRVVRQRAKEYSARVCRSYDGRP